jgi:hypothetical protein
MNAHSRLRLTPPPLANSRTRRRLCASLIAIVATPFPAGCNMAATLPPVAEHPIAHSIGRFDYALPAPLRSTGSTLTIYLVDIAQSPLPAGVAPAEAWKARLATELAAKSASRPSGVLTREFDLPGVGPAAWMRLTPAQPDLVTLLAQRPVAQAGLAVTLEMEASAGREQFAERIFTRVAQSWVPGSPQGFSTGLGAVVMQPSQNERASESFMAPGLSISIQTETVEEPDDGQNTAEPPPGGKVLLKQRRRIGTFEGIEQHTQLPNEGSGESLVYLWIFPGQSADGAAPRIRLAANAPLSHAAALDEAWNTLLATWRPRPIPAN